MSFDVFWAAYPLKVGKLAAIRSWQRQKPPLSQVLEALAWQMTSDQWKRGFIPHPTTYLNQGRWLDEPPIKLGLFMDHLVCPRCGSSEGLCADIKVCNRRWLDSQQKAQQEA